MWQTASTSRLLFSEVEQNGVSLIYFEQRSLRLSREGVYVIIWRIERMSVKQAPTCPASCFKHRVLGLLEARRGARLTVTVLRHDVK